MNVREWLRGRGLGQYEERFRDDKIDLDVLADLSDGDLEKLGIPLGDRKRLLKAIAELASRELLAAQARRRRPLPFHRRSLSRTRMPPSTARSP